MTDVPALPQYDNPPVIEVVAGVLFEELASLHGIQLGAFWEKLKPDYDHTREVAPLAPLLESFGEPRGVKLHLTDVPPLARTWLLTSKENGVIQVQRDRFLHNWKKVDPGDQHPRYSKVIHMFKERLDTFEEFLAENDLGPIKPLQYEMTYVNHIPQHDGWEGLDDAGRIFPDFVRRSDPGRFLPSPDAINWRTAFPLPNEEGRLHTAIRQMQRPTDQEPVLLFELTARGIPRDRSRDSMWAWFDLAHEWIVRGFTDLTAENVRRNVWKQTT